MKWNSLRVGTRLAWSFGLVFAAMAVLVAVSYLSTKSTLARIGATVDESAHKASEVHTMQLAVLQVGTAVRNIGITSDVADMNKYGEEFALHLKTYRDAEARLAAMALDASERAMLDRARQLGQQAEPAIKQAFGMAKAFDPEAAGKVLLGTLAPIQNLWLQEFQKLDARQLEKRQLALSETAAAIEQRSLIIALTFVLFIAAGAVFARQLTRSITVPLKAAVAHAEHVATGDLSDTVEVDGEDEAASVLRSFGVMSTQLAKLVGQVRQSVDSISTASNEIATGNQDLSARTEQQAATLQQTAASMSVLTEAVRRNAANAAAADALAQTTAQVSEQGSGKMQQLEQTMGAINESSRRIVEIISVIDGIAFQTNILALNAAVEAARAGEQGRGFAVVAGEVRTLAQRSAAAAKEIKTLISESVERVEAGGRLVTDTGQTMHSVLGSVNKVKHMIGEISVASNEQHEGIEQINAAVSNLDHGTQQNAALVEQAAAAAMSLREQAGRLAGVVQVFHLAGDRRRH